MNQDRLQAIELAAYWLTESGILELDDQHPAFGGIYESVNRPRGNYSKVLHLLNGYGISALINLHRRRRRASDLNLAFILFTYLQKHRRMQGPSIVYGACTQAYEPDELKDVEYFYAFDNAMILQGLCDLNAQTGDEDALDAAKEIANWLVENMQRPDGSFYSRVDLSRKKPGYNTASFEGDSGCIHAKLVIGLLRLHALIGDNRYLKASKEALEWVLALQREDGLFWANDKMRYVFTHAHACAAEGMLYGAMTLKDDRLMVSAQKAADALINIQLADGSMPAVPEEGRNFTLRALNIMLPYKATDATAQAIRLFALLYAATRDLKYHEAALNAEEYLFSVQIPREVGKRFAGAFHYQEAETAVGLHVRSALFAWVTQFALSAMQWMADIDAGGYDADTFLKELF